MKIEPSYTFIFLPMEWFSLVVLLCSHLETLGLWIRKKIECCHWYFRADLEDSNSKNNVDYGNPGEEVSDGKEILPVGLETILVTFCQVMWLVSSIV